MQRLNTDLNMSTPLLECTCFRLRQLELFYSRDMILGVLLSQDITPNMSWIKLEAGGGWMTSEVDSEVLRLHLNNLKQTYGQKIFKQAITIVIQPKQRKTA